MKSLQRLIEFAQVEKLPTQARVKRAEPALRGGRGGFLGDPDRAADPIFLGFRRLDLGQELRGLCHQRIIPKLVGQVPRSAKSVRAWDGVRSFI